MAGKTPQISDAEWQVMQVVWERSPIGSGEIVDQLRRSHAWHARTIKTLISRLVKKGGLTYEQEGNRYLYRPAVSREACVRQESRHFVQRVFGGDVGQLVAHLVRDEKLDPDEVKRLRRLLDEQGK